MKKILVRLSGDDLEIYEHVKSALSIGNDAETFRVILRKYAKANGIISAEVPVA